MVKPISIFFDGPSLWTKFLVSQIIKYFKRFLRTMKGFVAYKASSEDNVVDDGPCWKVHQPGLIGNELLHEYFICFQSAPVAPETPSFRWIR